MPAHHNPMLIKTYTAEVAITKYMAVIEGTSDGQANDPGAANDVALGIALHAAAAGEPVDVCLFGPCLAVADGAFSRGALLAISSTTGKVDAITIGVTTADQRVIGKALQTAGADGDLVSIFVGLNDYCAV